MSCVKIVITGGPCSGKTTAMSWIQNAFSQQGFKVLFIPETATELINAGITPLLCGTAAFQRYLMRLQIEKEKIFEKCAANLTGENVLLVCDRGVMDGRAYMEKSDFDQALQELGANEVEIRDGYDSVFHLVTAAKGAREYYTTANNSARSETVEEAAAVDDKLIMAWTGHPRLKVIDNSTDFEEKMKRLIGEITILLNRPKPLRFERRFLIENPNDRWLEDYENSCRVEIIQTYLKSQTGDIVRIRQRGIGGHFVYYKTVSRNTNGSDYLSIESRLTKDEYLTLIMEADPNLRPVRKTRYCITYHNHSIKVDVYPFWKDRAIAEIELSDENEEVVFPKEIKVVREVTGDGQFRDYFFAGK